MNLESIVHYRGGGKSAKMEAFAFHQIYLNYVAGYNGYPLYNGYMKQNDGFFSLFLSAFWNVQIETLTKLLGWLLLLICRSPIRRILLISYCILNIFTYYFFHSQSCYSLRIIFNDSVWFSKVELTQFLESLHLITS